MANRRGRPSPKSTPAASKEQLVEECLALHELLRERTSKLMQLDSNELCYLLSTNWLRQWKEYVGYWSVTEEGFEGDLKLEKHFGQRRPGPINQDIAASPSESRDFLTVPKEMEAYQYLNEITAREKAKEEDFIAVTRDIWEAFLKHYPGTPIRRLIRRQRGSTCYDGEPLRCQVILADLEDPELPQKLQKSSRLTFKNIFTTHKMQLPTLWDLRALMDFLALYCSLSFETSEIRVWRGYSSLGPTRLSEELARAVKEGRYSVKGKELTFEKYGEMDINAFIKSSHTLVLQVGRQLKGEPPEEELAVGYCEECCGKKELTISCVCMEVSYCSSKCRTNDQPFHFKTCSTAFDSESDEEFSLLEMGELPRAGLSNLGNTCYLNSTLQCLLSVPHLRQFLATNAHADHLSPEEMKASRCMFVRKLSKVAKKMAQKKEVAAWPMKGQVDYYLPGFRGYKQHDANDLLLHLLTILNDCLEKPGEEAYHPVLKPFVGQFHSKVACPHCQRVSENNQIFTQISLPLKPPTSQPVLQYTKIIEVGRIERGRTRLRDTWEELKAHVGAKNSTVGHYRQPGGIVLIEEETTSPAEAVKGARGDLFFYQDVRKEPGDSLFTFSLITTKQIMGNKMKAPYGPALPLFVNVEATSLGTFWLAIIRYFFPARGEETYLMEQQYFTEIQEVVLAESGRPQPEGQDEMESEACQAIVRKYNTNLTSLAKTLGMEVHVSHTRKSKKASGELPKIFDEPLTMFLSEWSGEVRFEVSLRKVVEFEVEQGESGPPEGVSLQDCLELFNEPEQLDEENAWYCESCDLMALAYKQLRVEAFPDILVLHLNRFKAVNDKKVKNSQSVAYGEYQEFGEHKYRLMGVVVHEGGMEAGHYWAIALRGDGYLTFNDQQVHPCNSVHHAGAYILVYGRVCP